MDYQTIIYTKKGHVAYITLNRPEALNAISAQMWTELTEVWTDMRDDDDIWVGITTGKGRAFCAGADLKEVAAGRGAGSGRSVFGAGPGFGIMRGIELWKPLIAAVNGLALGGGCELALAHDMRLASSVATFGLPEVKLALNPGWGGTQRLPRAIPLGLALEMLLTGRAVDAAEAYRSGLANHVYPPEQLMEAAEAMANLLCQNGPLSMYCIKEMAVRGRELSLDQGLRLENLIPAAGNRGSEDSKEGARAFVEKRAPVYKGR